MEPNFAPLCIEQCDVHMVTEGVVGIIINPVRGNETTPPPALLNATAANILVDLIKMPQSEPSHRDVLR